MKISQLSLIVSILLLACSFSAFCMDSKEEKSLAEQLIVSIRPRAEECPICYEPLIDNNQNGTVVHLACLVPHDFHRSCLREWARQREALENLTCPVCRRIINPQELYREITTALRNKQLCKQTLKGVLSGFEYGLTFCCAWNEINYQNLTVSQTQVFLSRLCHTTTLMQLEKLFQGRWPLWWRTGGNIKSKYPVGLWLAQRAWAISEISLYNLMNSEVGFTSLNQIARMALVAPVGVGVTQTATKLIKCSENEEVIEEIEPILLSSRFRRGWFLGALLAICIVPYIINLSQELFDASGGKIAFGAGI